MFRTSNEPTNQGQAFPINIKITLRKEDQQIKFISLDSLTTCAWIFIACALQKLIHRCLSGAMGDGPCWSP